MGAENLLQRGLDPAPLTLASHSVKEISLINFNRALNRSKQPLHNQVFLTHEEMLHPSTYSLSQFHWFMLCKPTVCLRAQLYLNYKDSSVAAVLPFQSHIKKMEVSFSI